MKIRIFLISILTTLFLASIGYTQDVGNPSYNSIKIKSRATFNFLDASTPLFTDASKGITSTGTVGVAKGGTGKSSVTANSYLKGNGTNALVERTYAEVASDLGLANAVVYMGVIDCSTNPNYPAANAGEGYIVSVAGKIGGASGKVVVAGDLVLCNADETAAGDEATVGTNWYVLEKNIDLTNISITGGSISGTDITVGAGKTLDVSAGTLVLSPFSTLPVAGTTGGFTRTFSEATVALSGASTTIQVNIPGSPVSNILGVQLRVDTAITSGDGATTWSATYTGGSILAISTGQAFTKNTKVDSMSGGIVTSETDIIITPNSGTFSGGVVRAIVYYETFTAMSDAS
jgi:hypothetical protein